MRSDDVRPVLQGLAAFVEDALRGASADEERPLFSLLVWTDDRVEVEGSILPANMWGAREGDEAVDEEPRDGPQALPAPAEEMAAAELPYDGA